MAALTAAQAAALCSVRSRATQALLDAERRIALVAGRAGLRVDTAHLAAGVRRLGRVAVHFHPDRITADGHIVVNSLLHDGVYRSQFETRISNGGLTAFPGGDRDRWEARLFDGAYQQPGVSPSERPKYGALDLMRFADGPCPRFGSCHLRLRPAAAARSTYSFGDSVLEPVDLGTLDVFEPVLAAMLETAETTGALLGRPQATVREVVDLLDHDGPPPAGEIGRVLDDVIEAQVHGPIRLAQDVEVIVADPSFMGTAIGETLEAITARYGLNLVWHAGFQLAAADVPSDFRGPAIPPLAERVQRNFGAGSLYLNAEIIGQAARSVITDPLSWSDWASPADTLQQLKQLWHVLVRYGTPILPAVTPSDPGGRGTTDPPIHPGVP